MAEYSIKKKLYKRWNDIKYRCYNSNCPCYNDYGGRGIDISKEWKLFENFYNDMSASYRLGLTLERIDNNKGYSKENCKWIEFKHQAWNRRNVPLVEWKGIKKCLAEWSKTLNIKPSTLRQRYYCLKWDIEKCLTYNKHTT